MENKFTKMEELVIQSLCKQAELVAGCDTLHYETTQEAYKQLITIQLTVLAGKIDITEAQNILDKVKETLS